MVAHARAGLKEGYCGFNPAYGRRWAVIGLDGGGGRRRAIGEGAGSGLMLECVRIVGRGPTVLTEDLFILSRHSPRCHARAVCAARRFCRACSEWATGASRARTSHICIARTGDRGATPLVPVGSWGTLSSLPQIADLTRPRA